MDRYSGESAMDDRIDGEAIFGRSLQCLAAVANLEVAVVGGGLAGLMAARTLTRLGAKVTVYEARSQVGGRVLSDTTFAKGRITEAGAELVGSIHTRWCALAKEYGIGLISRMDGDLYRGQQLAQRLTLDRPLTPDEVRALDTQKANQVLRPMAELARKAIQDPSRPWDQPTLRPFDAMTVGDALVQRFGVTKGSRLWKSMEFQLANDNVARLDQMNFLSLLCLVRGGQSGTIAADGLMGYWDELEIYRCADGCQRLALAIAAEVNGRKGSRVIRNYGVRRIYLPDAGGGVHVTARSTSNKRFDEWLREKIPPNPLTDTRRYDYLIFTPPPSVWGDIEILPHHPKDTIGVMGMGPAVKFFSRVRDRFWIKEGLAPLGGSLDLGQVWEGTDNQTRVKGQDTVLSVFAGARTPTEQDFKRELDRLYPAVSGKPKSGYLSNLQKTLLVDWSRQPFIRTGYSSPRVGQIFTIGKELNEPYRGRLFFAGEHTQLDHFGYMEGAIRSGQRAADLLVDMACGLFRKRSEPDLVAGAATGSSRGLTRVG
jgi:monoamine oxidase